MFSRALFPGVLLILGINAQIIDFNANKAGDPLGALNFWPFSPQFRLNFQELQPWWKGPNVCIERHEHGDQDEETTTSTTTSKESSEDIDILEEIPSHFQASLSFSSCFETSDKYECITRSNIHGDHKTNIVKYKCCHGYTRSPRFGSVCEKQAELLPLLEVLKKVNATDFRQLVKAVGYDDKLTNNNYTVFAPKNEALDNFTNDISEMNQIEVVRRDVSNNVKEALLNHLVSGFVNINDYENEDLLISENNNKSIRLNYYPTPGIGKLVTANCVRISRANVFATNGLVHIVDNVIPTAKGSIQEILQDPRVSSFKQALEASNLTDLFKNDGHYTIFLPTNEAFDKLDENTKSKLSSGHSCASTILKHHITPHSVCSAAIILNATVHDDNGEVLNLERKSEKEIVLEGKAKLVESDILLTNGVVHFIDTVLVPDSAKPVDEVLAKNNLTKFLQLAEEAGLKKELDSLSNVTYFIPFDAAFDEPEAEKYLSQIRNNKEKLRELILYHITKGKLESCDMEISTVLETEAEGKTLPLKVYPLFSNLFFKPIAPAPLVQCSTLTKREEKACGSAVHEIDRILIPPSKTLLELLESDPKLSIFKSIVEGTETEEKLKDANQNLTLIATTNYAFGRYKYNYEDLKENKTLANAVLKRHVMKKPVCCQQLESGEQMFSRWSPYSDSFTTSNSIKDCNVIATNGILHTTNSFLYQRY